MADGKRTIFTLTVFDVGHENMASALAHVQFACEAAGREVRAAGGGKLRGVVLGAGAIPIGEWQYDPNVAAS